MRELALQNCRLDDRYDLLRLLGRGSYAEIFVGLDNRAAKDSPNRTVVIKALNVFLQEEPDDDLERTLIENFQNEAVALDRVHHPNIISRLGHGTARDLHGTVFHYLVLEYLPGGDLAEMNKKQPFTFELMLRYIEQVCAGLDYAHRQKIIHRDIKPHNLLLTKNRQVVKIADFGVAKLSDDDSPITRVGTNVYAAPEHSPLMMAQANFSTKLTPAADVYSLAKTVYALLVGRSPREFSNAPISGLPQNLADKPWAKGVIRVLEKATQNEPSRRYQNVRDFWQELWQVKLALETDLPTQIAARVTAPLAAANVAGFSPQTPVLPKFDSMPNIQTKPVSVETLPKNPRPVVEAETLLNQPPRNNQQNVPANNRNGSTRQANVEQQKAQNNVQVQESNQSKSVSGVKSFFQKVMLRLAVVLILLGVFSAVLGGTYNFLQTRGWFPASFPMLFGQNATANKDAWLRDAPNGNKINLVSEGSDLKVFGKSSDGNWYNVEIVRQAQADKATSTVTRGYVGKTVVEIK